jgi:membrane fusion protein, multidrug efflux system
LSQKERSHTNSPNRVKSAIFKQKMPFAGVFSKYLAMKNVAKLLPTSLVLATALLAACSKQAPAPDPVRAVKILRVAPSSLSSTYEYAADVRARAEVRVGFRVGGKIIKRQAEVGQTVKAGQVVAQLDPADFALAANSARAAVQAAQTNRDLAAADFKRFQDLRAQNFISEAELQRREASLKAGQAQLDQAKAQLSVQGNQTAYAVLAAPVAGVVTGVEAEAGQVVQAGAAVLRIAQNGPRDAVFAVPEDRLNQLRLGDAVRVRTWAAQSASAAASSNAELQGRVHEIAATADPVTRTYQVKVALQDAALPLGSTVYVTVQNQAAASAQLIKLPTSALRQVGSGTAVWLLDRSSMTVRSQAVQVATADGNDAVIAAGIKPGDEVVSAGVHVLAEGQRVSIFGVGAAEIKPNMPVAGAEATLDATKKIANKAMAATPAASAAK